MYEKITKETGKNEKAWKIRLAWIAVLLIARILIFALGRMDMYSEKETMDPLKFGEIGERFYTNPLSIRQIGDPFILNASDNRYYCYATSAPDGFRVWYSEDLIHWKEGGMAFQREADSWAVRDFWAPEVIECNGKYHMFFSAREAKTESLRIGTSISDNPLGPFEDPLGRPLFDFGYAAIDASVFLDDDGSRYLYYSRDCSENIINGIHESHIYGVGLSDDMLSVASQPVLLMRPEQRWEEMSGYAWRWNEGPIVRKHDSVYYLFYSANYFASVAYSVGYGTAESPLGPFRKREDNPILMSKLNPDGKNPAPLISGPGHNSFAVSPNGKELFLVYHTHTDPEKGGGDRQMNLDRIGFRKDGSVYVNGPTLAPQVLPSGAGRFRNAALEARVSASSIKPGYKTEALTDGELGIHSYLAYLRDRLLLARELLIESGSVFVQIGMNPQLPGIPKGPDLLRLMGQILILAVLDIPLIHKGLEIAAVLDAVGRVDVDHLHLPGHALLLQQGVHHQQ